MKSQATPFERRLVLALFGLLLPGAAVVNCFPLLFGVLIDIDHMTPIAAGALFSAELLAGAFVALACGRWALRFDLRVLAITGSLVVAIGDLGSGLAPVAALVALRVIAGLGSGLVILAAGRVVALASRPSRLASYAAVGVSIAGTFLAIGAGTIMAKYGRVGGYLFLSAVGLIATYCASFAPAATGKQGAATAKASAGRFSASGIWLIAAGTAPFLGAGIVWNSAERIGSLQGFSAGAVTGTIALTSLAGIGGAGAAFVIAPINRPFSAAGVGCAILCGSAATLACQMGFPSYAAAMTLVSFAFVFVTPFLLEGAVRLDGTGMLAGAIQGGQLLAGAAAPVIAGLLVAGGSTWPLGLAAAACGLMSTFALARARSAATRASATPHLN